MPARVYDGPVPRSRTLSVQSPILRGMDVRLVQLVLSRDEFPVVADGLFGRNTSRAVSTYQGRGGLIQTGSVDLATFEAMGV